jgi:hypothetical protein
MFLLQNARCRAGAQRQRVDDITLRKARATGIEHKKLNKNKDLARGLGKRPKSGCMQIETAVPLAAHFSPKSSSVTGTCVDCIEKNTLS